MKDRVSIYPGRVKLVPVSGQENTYDMVRADSPTQEGAPLNKATFLKDATAALYGLDTTAVPDDVLALLQTLVSNAQTSADGKAKCLYGSYTGTGTNTTIKITTGFKPKFAAIMMNGYLLWATGGDWNEVSNIMFWAEGVQTATIGNGKNTSFTQNDDSLSFTAMSSLFNQSGKTYGYVILG